MFPKVKLLRDLCGIWERVALMVLALSTTLIVLGGVLYTRGSIARELPRAYLGTNPASATIHFESALDASQMAAITAEARRQPGISDAAVRTQLTLQLQQEGGGWGPYPLQIFVAMPDDPMRIETFAVKHWRQQRGPPG